MASLSPIQAGRNYKLFYKGGQKLQTYGLASALDWLVNPHATKNQRNATKDGQVYSPTLAKIEQTELSSQTDIAVTYWLQMAA